MPASQSRLLICLFASSLLSTTVLADGVIVTTAVDENNIDNQSCSLREAISYINAKKAKKAIKGSRARKTRRGNVGQGRVANRI